MDQSIKFKYICRSLESQYRRLSERQKEVGKQLNKHNATFHSQKNSVFYFFIPYFSEIPKWDSLRKLRSEASNLPANQIKCVLLINQLELGWVHLWIQTRGFASPVEISSPLCVPLHQSALEDWGNPLNRFRGQAREEEGEALLCKWKLFHLNSYLAAYHSLLPRQRAR